jgi:hypothetical protein
VVWTIPIPARSIRGVDLATGSAAMVLKDLPVRDFFTIPASFSGGRSVPATASLELHWSRPRRRYKLSNRKQTFSGDFVEGRATMTWTAQSGGYTFVADTVTVNDFAVLGYERNGIFYSPTI